MQVQKIYGNLLKKNSINFNSRVIYEDSRISLPEEIKQFIDDLEEKFPKYSTRDRREVQKGYSNGYFTVFSKSGGESGDVYMIKPNRGGKKFVIKESIPLRYKDRSDSDLGGLQHEYSAMIEASRASKDAQKPMAYVQTVKGASFLLSEFMPNIKEVNSKTSCEGKNGLKMDEKYLRSAIDIFEEYDKNGFFDPDMTRSNLPVDTTDGTAKSLDFQYALLKGYHSKDHNAVFTFADCEAETNCAAFEGGLLADYPIGELKELRKQHERQDFKTTVEAKKEAIREKLKEYFKIRAEYAEKLALRTGNDFERVKAEVYKNPSEDVIDAELLRMSVLRNNRLQFLYTDDNIERPRNMLKLVRYAALAKLSAKKLAGFVPQKTPRTVAEKEYFKYMREFGKDWDINTSKWYPATVKFLIKVIKGEEKANGRYFEDLFEGTKDEIFTLFKLMNNNIVEKDLLEVNDNVSFLERKLLALKNGNNFYSYQISELIDKLYSY